MPTLLRNLEPNAPVENTTLTLTSTDGWGTITVIRRLFTAYQKPSGQWMLDIRLTITGSSGSATNVREFSVADVLFKNTTDYDQSLLVSVGNSGFEQNNSVAGFARSNTNLIRLYNTSNFASGSYYWSIVGTVELESKPSWA